MLIHEGPGEGTESPAAGHWKNVFDSLICKRFVWGILQGDRVYSCLTQIASSEETCINTNLLIRDYPCKLTSV